MDTGGFVGGKKHGPWVSYYANGNKMSEGAFNMGRKDGRWVLYWPNGNTKSIAEFADGKYTGHYACYFNNGNKKWEGYYNPIRGNSADGTKDGVWLTYDENDGVTVIRRMTYKRGAKSKPDELPRFSDVPRIGPPPGE